MIVSMQQRRCKQPKNQPADGCHHSICPTIYTHTVDAERNESGYPPSEERAITDIYGSPVAPREPERITQEQKEYYQEGYTGHRSPLQVGVMWLRQRHELGWHAIGIRTNKICLSTQANAK